MKVEPAKRSNKLLWIPLAIFSAEFIGIIGYYWIFGGYMGDSTLTISRFVGLNTWSSLVFCICNLAIVAMLVFYLIDYAGIKSFFWRFLMYAFLICFVALSVSPHVPDNSMPAQIHIFFAGSMFVIMELIGFLTMWLTRNRATLILATSFAIYGMFFLVCDLFRVDWFMNGVLWFESAYLFAFFAVLINSNRIEK